MKLAPMDIDNSENVKRCSTFETLGPSHERDSTDKHGRLRKREKKLKLTKKKQPRKAKKDKKQEGANDVEKPGWMKKQSGKDENGEFIVINIDSVNSSLENMESDNAEGLP